MRALRRLLALSPAEQRLLITAVMLVVAARTSLRLFRYTTVRRLATRLARPAKRPPHLPADRIAWAVSAAGWRAPGGRNCLAQALVAQVLLGRHSHETVLRLGVTHTPGSRLEAHAWLEHNGVVIVGGHGAARYTPLPTLAGHLT